jgi:hypothetical protein
MLPASKDDFPKCLYLDQNKWIDLARAHYARPDGRPRNPYSLSGGGLSPASAK